MASLTLRWLEVVFRYVCAAFYLFSVAGHLDYFYILSIVNILLRI